MIDQEMPRKLPPKQLIPQKLINVTKLPKLGTTIKINANFDDQTTVDHNAIIDHLAIETIQMLAAKMTFRPWQKDVVIVESTLNCVLHTLCPISMEPVEQTIDTNIKARFVPPSSKLARPEINEDGEMMLEAEGDDLPDIYEGEHLDAWAIILEYLALEIDYFARADGANFEPVQQFEGDNESETSPFAVLQSLKK